MVYVISVDDKPLMPCKPAKAGKLLKSNRAKVIRKEPFTIKLLFPCEDQTQVVVAGMDTGSKIIGAACIGNGKVLYQSEVHLRDDIKRKMDRRRMYRRTRRGRKTRYREPRFLNRGNSTKENRLAPSIKSKIDAHLREKKFVESILPVTKWNLELASFDIHKISAPDVRGVEYQNGELKGYYNVKQFVLARDNYTCQHCKGKSGNKKLHVHHIVWRSKGGPDHQNNLITLCGSCHDCIHQGALTLTLKGQRSTTKYATEVGIIKSQLRKQFGDFEETFGYETKYKREQILNIPKTHYNDAVSICCEEGELVKSNPTLLIKRCVSKGDYKQTKGKRSEITIPTGKLFGFRKWDKVKTPLGVGFIRGKRSSGSFNISDIFGNPFKKQVNAKKNMHRVSVRKSTINTNIGVL